MFKPMILSYVLLVVNVHLGTGQSNNNTDIVIGLMGSWLMKPGYQIFSLKTIGAAMPLALEDAKAAGILPANRSISFVVLASIQDLDL